MPLPRATACVLSRLVRHRLVLLHRRHRPERNPADPNDHVWRGDGVEIYIDHDAVFAEPSTYDNPGTFQFIAGAPTNDSDPSTRRTTPAVTGATITSRLF